MKTGAKAPIHMVSAFAARQRLVLGQVKVAEKSNEIIAIPDLLDVLAIDGASATLDAMGFSGRPAPPLGTALLRLAAVYRWVCGAETGFGRKALAAMSAV